MSLRIVPVVALLATAAPAAGFAPPSSTTTSTSTSSSIIGSTSQQRPSALHMSSIPHASEESYPRLLLDASLCANSDSCPIESAEVYLREIIHVQSGCAAGTMSGNAVCDDVAGVAGVVAELRRKIGEGAEREVRTFWDYRQDELMTLAAASSASPLTAPLKPAYLAIAALYVVAIISMVQPAAMDVSSSSGVVPFTAQEMWWAVRDGYAGDLATHLFRNGGLAVGDGSNVAAAVGNSLSPQELLWSIRDGYAADTVFAPTGATVEGGVESVPFTPQEAWWAIRGGYGGDMLGHWFRNGGLSL